MKRERFSTMLLGLLVMALGTSVTIAGGGRGGGRGRGNAAATGPRGPAPTLTTPAMPSTRPDDEGFIRRWVLLEPMPANGVSEAAFRAVVNQEHFPNQFTIVPRDGDGVKSRCETSRNVAC